MESGSPNAFQAIRLLERLQRLLRRDRRYLELVEQLRTLFASKEPVWASGGDLESAPVSRPSRWRRCLRPNLRSVLEGPVGERPGGRSRASPVVAQNRSRLTWASATVVAVMVRHHRPQQNFTPHSTAPLRFPRRGGQATTTAP